MLSYFIVDDDPVSRRMLHTIIEKSGLGDVAGTAGGGREAVQLIPNVQPHVVLIDLLMPDQDGIETITQLASQGFAGKFVMISQVDNKEMVGQAYQAGIEFFIHKPINKIEVEAVLRRVNGQYHLDRSLLEIRRSLAVLEQNAAGTRQPAKERTVRDVVQHILMNMGIGGESGSKDIIAIMEHAVPLRESELPPLKELYEAIARKPGRSDEDVVKECKAIEQRLRRTVMAALTNLASLGLTDYGNPKFEHYATLYFDFNDVRVKMKEIENDRLDGKGKVNVKKFLQVLSMEATEKLNEHANYS